MSVVKESASSKSMLVLEFLSQHVNNPELQIETWCAELLRFIKKTRTHLRGELKEDCQGQNLIIQTD